MRKISVIDVKINISGEKRDENNAEDEKVAMADGGTGGAMQSLKLPYDDRKKSVPVKTQMTAS